MKKLLFFVCAIFAFVACTQAHIEEQQGIEIDTPEILTVGFEDGDQTRIQLNEAQKTVWNKEDLASVFYRSDANQKWQYQGETGERVGNLKRMENAVGTTKTTKTIVVYPYNESYWLNTDSYAIEATLPATQYYTEGSYGVGSNLMVSQSEFTQFSLKSVCGWLKLQLTGNGELVKSIKFRGNNEEQVAGLIYVDTATAEATLASEMGGTDDNNAGGNLIFDDTVITELTLDCGEGVTLGKEVTTFYLSLPPQTFANGFTVDIECVDNEPFTLSTTNELIIERNTIQPMAAVEVEHEPVEVKPANNEIWYTNGSTTKATTPDSTDVFGVNIVSNTYDAEKECWVIKFDGDVTKIGDEAFYRCSSLTSITIPDSVTTIGGSAFSECSSLTSVTIPDSVTTIGDSAFNFCSSLTSVTIPNSVTTIGEDAFSRTSLTSVTIPDSVTTIGEVAFCNCRQLQEFKGKFASEDGRCLIQDGTLIAFAPAGLTEYAIPNSVTTIGYGAFSLCKDLTSVTIPDSVTTIGYHAFYMCSSLTSVTIPDSVTTIGHLAFYDCSSLTSITIPNSVTTIDNHTFANCLNLTSVNIPDSVTTIGDAAFCNCSGLTSVTIPDSVTSIGDGAFDMCSSLTSVTIPDSVTTIGEYAFDTCSSLTSVYCEATTPPTGDYYMFRDNASDRKIYVPRNSVEAYKSAEHWSEYAEDIVGYDFATDETLQPANNEIWYTNGSTTEATTPSKTNAFGVNIVSNTYDAEKECWVIKFEGDVTKIGTHAFQYCSSLTSVTIPDSVTTIGYHAFYYCSSLTSVTIGNSVTTIGEYAFDTCSSLTSVTIPDSVTTIGDWAFSYCYGLTSVTIGNSVTTIGKAAFYCCYGLTSVTIGNSVTTIGEGAFRNCSQLQEFKGKFASEDGRCLIIEGVLELFAPASITEYTIPDSVTTIGYQAFYDCHDLTSVTIPNSVTTIGDYAFCFCSNLTSVTIPNSVTTIGEVAFGKCSHLQEFKGKFASDDGRCLIIEGVLNSFAPAGLTEYAIPNSVTTIGVDAFSECSGLTSVTIPNSVTTIGYGAFYFCSNLTSVTIPDSVTTIDDYAFGFCKSLTSVTIPDSVTTIGYQAFYYCSSLKSVYCEDTTPPTGDYCMFDYNASDRKIYVPRNSVEAYKSAGYWSEYASDIVGYDF